MLIKNMFIYNWMIIIYRDSHNLLVEVINDK